jgi:thiol-disulfide isomerase/thioredoxin
MKKIVLALATLAIVSCKKEDVKLVDYTLISGKITNKEGNDLKIYKGRELKKEISLDENGMFSDTLRLESGEYVAVAEKQFAQIYVANGQHFNITLDTKDFDNSISFKGEGAKANELLSSLSKLQENLDYETLLSSEKDVFETGVKDFKSKFIATLSKGSSLLDSTTVASQGNAIDQMTTQLSKMYASKNRMKEMIGKPSVAFNYENHKGGKTSLSDLKGKYVYIDLWATWCGPCKKEIPFLKEVEKKYHNKNIEFVSISVDKNKEAWKKMVDDKKLGGVQLHYGNDNNLSKAYEVTGIPRFILLDINGNIVDADAPRPSSQKLIELLTDQGI